MGTDRVEWARQTSRNLELARALSALADLQEDLERYQDAYRLRRERLEVLEKISISGSAVALAHLQLARNLTATESFEQADSEYQAAIDALGPERGTIYEVWIWEDYAEFFARQGKNRQEALARFKAATIRAALGSEPK
jgi:tetratricopeptide (TPR) repeat protein